MKVSLDTPRFRNLAADYKLVPRDNPHLVRAMEVRDAHANLKYGVDGHLAAAKVREQHAQALGVALVDGEVRPRERHERKIQVHA